MQNYLLSCASVTEMISIIFRMYKIKCSLSKNVNYCLSCLLISLICKLLKEHKGILHFIELLQSSIESYSHVHLIPSDVIVDRSPRSGDVWLIPLFHSMIGEVIAWSNFTNTSLEQESVINNFITMMSFGLTFCFILAMFGIILSLQVNPRFSLLHNLYSRLSQSK
jgi:hypothetical protein